MGEDGHIASLFPFSPVLNELSRLVVPVNNPKLSYQRLSITPAVIKGAQNVFVMALGDIKFKIYQEALKDPLNINPIPARLVINRNWIFN